MLSMLRRRVVPALAAQHARRCAADCTAVVATAVTNEKAVVLWRPKHRSPCRAC